MGLEEGDYMEVTSEHGKVSMKPKKLVDPDDALPAAEAEKLRQAIKHAKAGKTKPWTQLKHELGL